MEITLLCAECVSLNHDWDKCKDQISIMGSEDYIYLLKH